MGKRKPRTINNKKTLIVSSLVIPYCNQDACKTNPTETIGFKTIDGHEIDFDYRSDEVSVMMTKDGHGLSYLGYLLGRLNIPILNVEIRDPSSIRPEIEFRRWGTVISIGSHLSNSVTARIIDEELAEVAPNRIKFQFSEFGAEEGDRIICLKNGEKETSELSPSNRDADIAAIVHFTRLYEEEPVNFYVLAGLGPQGTLTACYRLACEYNTLLNRGPFFQVLEMRRGHLMPQITILADEKLEDSKEIIMSKRFAVALSFPGEHRPYIEKVADALAATLTNQRVFYDRYHEAELSRPNLDTYLQKIYHDESELVVVVLCKEYDEKEWCGLEFRAIRDLVKQRRDDEIMFVRIAGGDVKGVFGIDGYVDAQNREPEDIAKVICKRFEMIKH